MLPRYFSHLVILEVPPKAISQNRFWPIASNIPQKDKPISEPNNSSNAVSSAFSAPFLMFFSFFLVDCQRHWKPSCLPASIFHQPCLDCPGTLTLPQPRGYTSTAALLWRFCAFFLAMLLVQKLQEYQASRSSKIGAVEQLQKRAYNIASSALVSV